MYIYSVYIYIYIEYAYIYIYICVYIYIYRIYVYVVCVCMYIYTIRGLKEEGLGLLSLGLRPLGFKGIAETNRTPKPQALNPLKEPLKGSQGGINPELPKP